MAKPRSPNYPAISLPDAIDRARKIYEKEHTHKAPSEVMAKALGYNGLNGKSLGVLSALKKYGLLEEIGQELKIGQDTLTILVDPPHSLERANAIRRAAFLPVLFEDIRKNYGDTIPSDENLRAFLLKKGFIPSAVDSPIRSYRETIGLVNSLVKDDNYRSEQNEQEVIMQNSQSAADRGADFVAKSAGMAMPRTPTVDSLTTGHKRDTFSLDQGQAALEWPENLTAESYEDFESWIQLQLRKIKRSIN
jgi:hypothetical protein